MRERDEQAFTTAIAAEPENDFPRLAFADWLDEQPDDCSRARGELIRIQCELERDDLPGKRRNELHRIEQELLFDHWNQWTVELRRLGLDSRRISFRRGFVEHAVITPDQFIHTAEELFAAAPMLRSLELIPAFQEHQTKEASSVPAKFFAMPQLGRIAELSANRVLLLDDADCDRIASCPHLAQLMALELPHHQLSDRGFLSLAKGTFTQSLRRLVISDNRITSIGLERLPRDAFPQLHWLDLSGNRIADSGVIAISENSGLARLQHLDISRNPIGNAAAHALLESTALDDLIVLSLPTWNLADDVRGRLLRRFQLVKPIDAES